jgi:hypothetical protein
LKEVLSFLADNKDLIGPLITAIGILTSILIIAIPGLVRKYRSNRLLTRNIELYLMVLKDDIITQINKFEDDREMRINVPRSDRPISWSLGPLKLPDAKDTNKITHKTLEQLFLEAGSIAVKKREKLSNFIRYFKTTEEITNESQHRKYYGQLSKVLAHFRQSSLCDRIFKRGLMRK